jgi:cell shape-determining protein MreC
MRIRGFFLQKIYACNFHLHPPLIGAHLDVLKGETRQGITFVDALVTEIVSPFQKVSTFLIKTVHGVFQNYVVLVHLQRENLLLKQKIAELERENHQMKEMAYANERFQRLLSFGRRFPPVIVAEVIGGDPLPGSKALP